MRLRNEHGCEVSRAILRRSHANPRGQLVVVLRAVVFGRPNPGSPVFGGLIPGVPLSGASSWEPHCSAASSWGR
eukprot:2215564-Prymnesium_polylepis.1